MTILLVVVVSAQAGGTPGEPVEGSSDATTAAITNQPLDDTLQALQSAGIHEGNPTFAGATSLEVADDGGPILRYHEDHAAVAELLSVVDSMQGQTPIPVRAVPVAYAIGDIEALGPQLLDDQSPLASKYGVSGATSFWVDTLRGEATLTVAGDAPPESRRVAGNLVVEIEGVPVKVDTESGPTVDFQLGPLRDDAVTSAVER